MSNPDATTSIIVSRPAFQSLFDALRASRSRYERLRSDNGSFSQRADLIEQLHELRADLAVARRGEGVL